MYNVLVNRRLVRDDYAYSLSRRAGGGFLRLEHTAREEGATSGTDDLLARNPGEGVFTTLQNLSGVAEDMKEQLVDL